MSTDPSKPLDDQEIGELDELLAGLPDEHDPLDVAMLDGYLIGILLQPEPVAPENWLPLVFDAEGRDLDLEPDHAGIEQATALILRRYNELAACIAAREPFDPVVFEVEDDEGNVLSGTAGIAALEPWAAGFTQALSAFPSLQEQAERDEDLASTMIGVLRHLPMAPDAEGDELADFAREQADINRDLPLADLDDAIDALVESVLDIADITRPNRPVTRAAPKVGRNDPCPCGSGRKYKNCHGGDVN